MIDVQAIAYLRLAHGVYNFMLLLLFMYQGCMGLRIRKHRLAKIPDFKIIKRHRKSGPVFAVMGAAGFFAGIILVYLDYGILLKYPLHFITGLAVVFSIISAYLVSGNISSPDSPWRASHMRRGILVLCLYIIQAVIGLGILL